ncbi:hypothetical protein GGR52DRAFT_110240 [Hypoxylon sp. FL1284]|nr:hypothetical protein GGR52DRAFT_110240 [Hypoxylon sp. FL1284]
MKNRDEAENTTYCVVVGYQAGKLCGLGSLVLWRTGEASKEKNPGAPPLGSTGCRTRRVRRPSHPFNLPYASPEAHGFFFPFFFSLPFLGVFWGECGK